MKEEYLPFEQCLDRLKHSFLRVVHASWGTYIDFQHPSLRDMLLKLLQNEPKVRRQYISLASPQGLCDIIQGVSFFGLTPTDDVHSLIIRDEEEVNLLCERIRIIVTDTIPAGDQIKLLISAETLLPRINEEIINASDADLEKFLMSPKGKVIGTLLRALADEKTYGNNLSYTLSAWVIILEKFYQLAPYIIPIPRPSYITNLVFHIKDTDILDEIQFIRILFVNEPIIFKQVFSQRRAQQLNESLNLELDECSIEGNELDCTPAIDLDDYEEKYSAYEDWEEKAKVLLGLATAFYSYSKIRESEEFSALEDLLESAEPPQEPEGWGGWEEDMIHEYNGHISDEKYWTTERLFEDL